MGGYNTIGDVNARFVADTKQFDTALEGSEAKIGQMKQAVQSTAQAIQEAGGKIDSAGTRISGAMKKAADQTRETVDAISSSAKEGAAAVEQMSRAQERSLERARRAWQREKLAQFQAIDREQAASRQGQLAALRADIEQRSADAAAMEEQRQATLKLAAAQEAEARTQVESRAAMYESFHQQAIQMQADRYSELAALRADIEARSEASAVAGRESLVASSLAGMQGELAERTTMAAIAQRTQNEVMESAVPQYAATSAGVRLMEGNLNNMVRAAERFVGQFSFLSGFMMKAFPVVGGIAMGYLLTRLGGKVADLYENFVNLRSSIEAVGQAELDVARDSARMASTVESNIEDILSKTQGEPAAIAQKLKFQQSKGIDLSSFFFGEDFKKETKDLPFNINKHYVDLYRSIGSSDMFGRLDKARKELTELKYAASPEANAFGSYVKQVGGYGPESVKNAQLYYQQRATVLSQIIAQMEGAIDVRQSQLQATQADLGQAQKNAAKTGAGGRSPIEIARDNLMAMRARHTMTLAEQADYWRKIAAGAKRGSALYVGAMNEANRDMAELREQQARDAGQALKDMLDADLANQRAGEAVTASLTETWVAAQKRDEEAGKQMLAAARQAFLAAEQQQHAADQLAAERVRAQYERGQLSRSDAARKLAEIHQNSYADYMGAAADWSRQFPDQAVPGAMRQSAYYAKLAQSDAQAQIDASVSGSVRRMFDQYVQAATDTADQISRIMANALTSVNESLSQSLMVHANTGWEYRRNIEQGLSNTARGIGSQVMNAGMQHLEGSVLSKFGFGPKGKLGESEANPMWVRMAGTQASGSASSILSALQAGGSSGLSTSSGILSTMISALPLIPGFADGGSIPSNLPAIVGERGPELFVPNTAGRIIPNDQLGFGDTHVHHNISIDARGAHDPASVEAAVHRAMGEWAPKIISASVQLTHERKLRQPSTVR